MCEGAPLALVLGDQHLHHHPMLGGSGGAGPVLFYLWGPSCLVSKFSFLAVLVLLVLGLHMPFSSCLFSAPPLHITI